MNHIAILLTVFNRKEKTIKCLRNITAQSLPADTKFDIYIVDGGSTDGTVESVKTQFPHVNIKTVDGVFWNRGMIEAWKMAEEKKRNGCNYDYYLWLNDDTFIYKDCIASLLRVSLLKKNRTIVLGSTVDTQTRSKLTYGGRDKTGKVARPSSDDSPVPVIMMNGNIVLVPHSVYKKLGTLDPYYTHARGDFDYGLRARKAGIDLWQVGHPLGECDAHEHIDAWCDPEIPLKKRWKLMYRPNGMPPMEIFHLENRHYGFCIALKHYFTIHLRCIWPNLWIKAGKANINKLHFNVINRQRL